MLGADLEQLQRRRRELEDILSRRRTWTFVDAPTTFLHNTLQDSLESLNLMDSNERTNVERRLHWAKNIREWTLHHPNARHEWNEVRSDLAIACAASPSPANLYAGASISLRDEDIYGLVPIGKNPATGLWEFYELRSAWDGKGDVRAFAIPTHEPNGAINVTADTGIVLVLLPGGTFLMGAQKEDKNSANYDPGARTDETPHEVTLAPFFLARHELTRAQWQRLSGTSPFWWNEGKSGDDPFAVGPCHPADSIDWINASRWMLRCGLELPTEAQWEYGCRAGTATPWWSGTDSKDMQGCANVHDQMSGKQQPQWGAPETIHGWVRRNRSGRLLPRQFVRDARHDGQRAGMVPRRLRKIRSQGAPRRGT